jgi:hypothetical protein
LGTVVCNWKDLTMQFQYISGLIQLQRKLWSPFLIQSYYQIYLWP